MTTQITDSELVQTMLGGDKEAFAELYRRRQRDVYRFALHMTGIPDVAEDVTQEVFMVLMRRGNATMPLTAPPTVKQEFTRRSPGPKRSWPCRKRF